MGSSRTRPIGRSPEIVAIRKAIARLGQLDTPVLIVGERRRQARLAGGAPPPEVARSRYRRPVAAW